MSTIEDEITTDFDSIYIKNNAQFPIVDIIDNYYDASTSTESISQTDGGQPEVFEQKINIEDSFDESLYHKNDIQEQKRVKRLKRNKENIDKLQLMAISAFLLVGGGYLLVNK